VETLFPLDSTEQKSSLVEEEHLHGCFSPGGSPCSLLQPDMPVASESEGMDGILAPIVQITPELNELCGESPVLLPLEEGSDGALAMAVVPSQPQSLASVVESWRIALMIFLLKSFAACSPV
jgi:hypothetical protein